MIEIDKLKAFGQALLYLSPELIPFLVPVILQSSSQEIQQMVSVVIVHLSQRDIGPLEKIVEQHGTEMGDKLLAILNRLQGDRVNRILFKMCDHSSIKGAQESDQRACFQGSQIRPEAVFTH